MSKAGPNRRQTEVLDRHVVRFYEGADNFIYESVAEFLAAGIKAGEPVVVVCTVEHWKGLCARMDAPDVNINRALSDSQLRWLDAYDALAAFMDGTTPDPGRFGKYLGSVLEEMRIQREHKPIRAFGEMVDLLLQDGNPEGAIRLEELWNRLGQTYGFSLLCAYNMGNLYREQRWRYFERICEQHARLDQGENGTASAYSGTFRSVCCGAQAVVDHGANFPDCPNHPRLPTIWKRISSKTPGKHPIEMVLKKE